MAKKESKDKPKPPKPPEPLDRLSEICRGLSNRGTDTDLLMCESIVCLVRALKDPSYNPVPPVQVAKGPKPPSETSGADAE